MISDNHMMQQQEINKPYNNNFEYIPSPMSEPNEDPYGGIVTDVDYPLDVSKTQQQTPGPVFPSIPAKGGVYSKTGILF